MSDAGASLPTTPVPRRGTRVIFLLIAPIPPLSVAGFVRLNASAGAEVNGYRLPVRAAVNAG